MGSKDNKGGDGGTGDKDKIPEKHGDLKTKTTAQLLAELQQLNDDINKIEQQEEIKGAKGGKGGKKK
jgi:hypothetical protein